MFVVEIDFRHPAGDVDVDRVTGLLAAMYKNGQLLRYPSAVAEVDFGVRATAIVPEPDALSPANSNEYVRADLLALESAGVQFGTSLVGAHAEGCATCRCEPSTEYILFTQFLMDSSPLRCGNCFGQIPLYRVPYVQDGEHLCVLQWQADYQACDTLQMACTVGERFAERQLADVDSALSREGRELCARLEEGTGAPVFYYLHKMRARSLRAERRRSCPGCGGAWMLEDRLHDLFDFRCLECRLLGNVACGVD